MSEDPHERGVTERSPGEARDGEVVPDLELDESSSEQVSGGSEPPGGPVPLPYPNTLKD